MTRGRNFLEEVASAFRPVGPLPALWLFGLCLGILNAQSAQDPGLRGTEAAKHSARLTGRTYALLIGISQYQHDPPVRSLQFADKDAETFRKWLIEPRGGGLNPETEIRILTNEQATRAAIDDAVNNFVIPHEGPGNTLIVFVAAHGVHLTIEKNPKTQQIIEKNPYILTYESNTQDPNTTGYPMEKFRSMVAERAAGYGRVLVFVDVCRAENVAGLAGASEVQEPVRKLFEEGGGEFGLLLASQAKKPALESSSFGGGHGAFSYFLISGLNGEAADSDAHSISFEELFHYVYNNVYDFTKHQQVPLHVSPNPDMVVVPELHRSVIELSPATRLTDNEVRDIKRNRTVANLTSTRSVTVPVIHDQEQRDAFDQALARGLLLDAPDSASSVLARMRQDPNAIPSDIAARGQRLHVALSDRGQQILSRYLDGDQEAMLKGDFELCTRYFDEAFQLAPSETFDRSRALFCRGRALIFDRQYDAAEDSLRQSIRLDARHSYAYNALGIAELERSARAHQDLSAAADAFETAIRFAPYWAYPLHNLALLESERGNYDEAIRLYEIAARRAPQFSYLPYNLGLLYEKLGDLEKARHSLDEALAIAEKFRPRTTAPFPEGARVENAQGTVARDQGHTARAAEWFAKALADDPDDPHARHNLALILAQRGDFASADRYWANNLTLEPKFLPSWISYAESLAARKQTAQATARYEEIVRDQPDYVGAREALARLYLSQARWTDAIGQLDEALRRAKASAVLFELRGDAETAAGRKDAARADWKRASESGDRAMKSRVQRKLRTGQ